LKKRSYQTPAAVGGPVGGTWSAKMRKTALQDTQEIAKSFWSYFYGGLS
jgi:hypothetical protein